MVGTIIKIGLVFGLLLLTLRMVGRLNGRTGSPVARESVRVVGRSSLGRNSSLVVVQLGQKHYVLGVTEQAVNLLTEVMVDDADPVEPAPARTPAAGDRPTWRELLESVRERTVRR